MKSEISTRAQNEVKELLNEYVVSPLNADISGTLKKVCDNIEEFARLQKDSNGEISAVTGQLSFLKNSLTEEQDNLFENLSEKINDINNNLDSVKKEFSSSAELEPLSLKIQDIEDLLLKIDAKSTEFDEKLSENNNKIMKLINTTFQSISDTCKEHDEAESLYREDLKAEIEANISQQRAFTENKFKMLFTVSLAFGIVNTICLIVMIILFIVK